MDSSHIHHPEPLPPDQAATRWLAQLSDPDRRVQKRAAYELCRLRDARTIPTLMSLLGHTSPTSYYAQRVLGQMGEPAIAPVLAFVEQPTRDYWDLTTYRRALTILGRLKARPAVMPLIKILKLTDGSERELIPWVLGLIGDGRAYGPLVAALHDGKSRVARNAAVGLGLLGDARALTPLLTALGSDDLVVRRGAAEGLGALGQREAVLPLIQALRDPIGEVRYEAVLALARIGDPRALASLQERVQLDTEATNEGVSLTDAAAIALGMVGGPWQHDVLVRVVQKTLDWRLGQFAIHGLAQLADSAAVDFLVHLLQSVEDYQRFYVAVELGRIGDRRVLQALEEVAATDTGMLEDGRTVATAAASAAAQIRQHHEQ